MMEGQTTLATLLEGIPGGREPTELQASWLSFSGEDCPQHVGQRISHVQRCLSHIAHSFIHQVENGGAHGCVSPAEVKGGFVAKPDWSSRRDCALPNPFPLSLAGEWQHGWQYHASFPLEHHFRRPLCLPSPLLLTRELAFPIGPWSERGVALRTNQFKMQPVFRSVILQLRLPLDTMNCKCECGGSVDNCHCAACPRSGRLWTGQVVPERTLCSSKQCL